MNQRRRQSGPPQGRNPVVRAQLPRVNGVETLQALFGERMLHRPRANPGLVFDRYLKIWASDTQLVKERHSPLKDFVKEYGACAGELDPLLVQTHQRLRGLVGGPERGELIAVTEERLVSGLGSTHALENGFCFDSNMGVPHLPGSSVKGLCRQVAEAELDSSTVRTLLGSGDEDQSRLEQDATVGDIVFFAAYPKTWPKLEIDVINCHQPDYYGSDPIVLSSETAGRKVQDGARRQRVGPLEVEDPVPVFFLTVAKGTKFVFRCKSRSNTKGNVDQALALLKDGLAGLGIGAKTTVGYGVMGESR